MTPLQKIRARRKEEGRCRDCEEPRLPGSPYCERHRKQESSRGMKWYFRRRPVAKFFGICRYCWTRQAMPRKSICGYCAENR